MTKIDFSPLYRSTIGFDRLPTLLDSALRTDQSTGYPHYNIEIVDDNHYAITLAVAGFAQDELEVVTERNLLTVRGSQKELDGDRRFLYRGIATRSFERKFNLADHVFVSAARYENGLLTISLEREIPEAMKPRQIEILHAA